VSVYIHADVLFWFLSVVVNCPFSMHLGFSVTAGNHDNIRIHGSIEPKRTFLACTNHNRNLGDNSLSAAKPTKYRCQTETSGRNNQKLCSKPEEGE
jgi:hypothetical protein